MSMAREIPHQSCRYLSAFQASSLLSTMNNSLPALLTRWGIRRPPRWDSQTVRSHRMAEAAREARAHESGISEQEYKRCAVSSNRFRGKRPECPAASTNPPDALHAFLSLCAFLSLHGKRIGI